MDTNFDTGYIHIYDDKPEIKPPKIKLNIELFGKKIDNNSTLGRVIQATQNTTFGRFIRKVKEYSEAPEIDEKYNPQEVIDDYKKAGVKLNKKQLQAIYTAGNKTQAEKALNLIDIDETLNERLQKESLGYKALSVTADILGDPLNFVPMGWINKGSKLAKIGKGAVAGGALGSVYAKVNEETTYEEQNYKNYILTGTLLGGSLSALGTLLDKDVDKLFDKDLINNVEVSRNNFIEKGINTDTIKNKTVNVINSMFDDVFTKLHKSENDLVKDIGLALAPDTAGNKGNHLFSGIGIKRVLNKQYQQTLKEYDNIISSRSKEYNLKKEAYEEYVSHYHYLQSIKEDLEKQIKELDTPILQQQLDDITNTIKSLEKNFPTIEKDTEITRNFFRNFRYHYEQVGGRLSNKKWYAPTKWDFERIKNIPTEVMLKDFVDAVNYSNMYEKYVEKAQKVGDEILTREEFVKEVANKIVDSLKNKRYNGVIDINPALFKKTTGGTAGATYRLKIRGINKYPVMHYMKTSFFDNLGEYGFKMSSNIALRYTLENLKSILKNRDIEITDDLVENIIDMNIHSPNEVYKRFIDIAKHNGELTQKDEDLIRSAVRTITGYNNVVDNPDSLLYKAGQFIDRLSTFMFGSHFGYVSALTDLPSSQIGATLLKTTVGKSIVGLPKELTFLEKQWKNREIKNSMGEFMYKLGVFADRLVNTRWISLETKLIEKQNPSLFQKFIDMMDTANVKIFEWTGTNWVGGMSEAIVYHTFMEDFMKIATNPKLADMRVINTLGLSKKDAIELGNWFKKSLTKDSLNISHISFEKLYNNVKEKIIKDTITPQLKKQWEENYIKNRVNRLKNGLKNRVKKEILEDFIKISPNHNINISKYKDENIIELADKFYKEYKDFKNFVNGEYKKRVNKLQQEAYDKAQIIWENTKKDKILSKYLSSEDGQAKLDFLMFNDKNSPIFKFNVAIQNAIDVFSVTGNVTRAAHIINDAQRANEYFINTLLGKFVKLPASVHSTMMRNRILNNKPLLGSMIIQGALVYGLIDYLIDSGLYNAGLTHRRKYDLDTEKGQEKLLMKAITYTTPMASLGILIENTKALTGNERGGMVTRTIPGLSVADQLSRAISQEPLSVKQFRNLLTLTPPAHLPILGEVIRDELYNKMSDKDGYQQWLAQEWFNNKSK